MLAGEGGQHGWRELILPIFANGSLRRLIKAACRGVRLRRILASPPARRSHGSAVFARRAAPRLARWRTQAEGDRGLASRLADWAVQGARLHVARPCDGTGRTRPQGRLPLGVGVRPRREAELQKKPFTPASRIVRTSREGGRNGRNISIGLILPASFSLMKHGPRPIWRRCGDGRLAA